MRQWHYWTTLEAWQIRVLYRPDHQRLRGRGDCCRHGFSATREECAVRCRCLWGWRIPVSTTPFFHARRCPLTEDRCAAVGGGKIPTGKTETALARNRGFESSSLQQPRRRSRPPPRCGSYHRRASLSGGLLRAHIRGSRERVAINSIPVTSKSRPAACERCPSFGRTTTNI